MLVAADWFVGMRYHGEWCAMPLVSSATSLGSLSLTRMAHVASWSHVQLTRVGAQAHVYAHAEVGLGSLAHVRGRPQFATRWGPLCKLRSPTGAVVMSPCFSVRAPRAGVHFVSSVHLASRSSTDCHVPGSIVSVQPQAREMTKWFRLVN